MATKATQHNSMDYELFRQAEEAAPKCFVCGLGVNNPYQVTGVKKREAFDGFYFHHHFGANDKDRLKWVHIDCAQQLVSTLFGYLGTFGQRAVESLISQAK